MARFLAPQSAETSDRVVETVMLLGRRGYALSPARLASVCIGGSVAESDVRWAAASRPELALAEGLVLERSSIPRAHSSASLVLPTPPAPLRVSKRVEWSAPSDEIDRLFLAKPAGK